MNIQELEYGVSVLPDGIPLTILDIPCARKVLEIRVLQASVSILGRLYGSLLAGHVIWKNDGAGVELPQPPDRSGSRGLLRQPNSRDHVVERQTLLDLIRRVLERRHARPRTPVHAAPEIPAQPGIRQILK